MTRFLILVSIAVSLGYVDMKLFYGFIIGLVYSIACGMIDERNDKGDC